MDLGPNEIRENLHGAREGPSPDEHLGVTKSIALRWIWDPNEIRENLHGAQCVTPS